ncbi:hypothetical protein HUO14_04320 [Parasphingorhabdus flavimaris]|jgi:hypothetical protein|uniref:DUF2147 domain-containing protein n=1 Tax=Parasphingorhabdus flavimaris TaxID=266812 RepID=A0ABX2N0B2_9SPHN|nr:hypothetical protein [Parasphingorhabdus flavimaris]NVD27135.1 hypothetical protein [Parasphingorhabdus flavimaris]|tara:strand:+ start:5643 stop:6011 length:369 start_codon:yes stop_codon:yes gene_type:complete
MDWRYFLFAVLAVPIAPVAAQDVSEIDPGYFEGRWALLDESCEAPTNWTMIGGGNFVSEDLVGTWIWLDGKLVLSLDDLAIDEETGEAGGRFRMDGPVSVVDSNRFDFTIEPDIYQLKRCPE